MQDKNASFMNHQVSGERDKIHVCSASFHIYQGGCPDVEDEWSGPKVSLFTSSILESRHKSGPSLLAHSAQCPDNCEYYMLHAISVKPICPGRLLWYEMRPNFTQQCTRYIRHTASMATLWWCIALCSLVPPRVIVIAYPNVTRVLLA